MIIKEVPINEILKVHNEVPEFARKDSAHFEERLQDGRVDRFDSLVIAVYENDNPVGYSVSYNRYDDDSIYVWMAGVHPDYRRRGVLKEMIKYISGWASGKGYKRLILKTRNERREMMSYLVTHGWNVMDVKPKKDINKTRILFEKRI